MPICLGTRTCTRTETCRGVLRDEGTMVAKFFLPSSARPNKAGGEGARGGMQVDQESFPSSQLYMELRALFASTPPPPPPYFFVY
jgi:hypothetical protein